MVGRGGFEPPTSQSRTERATTALPPVHAKKPHRKGRAPHSAQTGATGLEPAISGVTGQRDNQLRYAPDRKSVV